MTREAIVYHPLPPYGKVRIRPGWLRWLGLRRTPFATISELAGAHPARKEARIP